MSSRRRARQAALQILFQVETSSITPEDAIRLYWGSLYQTNEELPKLDVDREFADALALGYAGHQEEVDAQIRSISEHWRLERMPAVDRNILRIGTYEILCTPETPLRVVLNEAVELAKRYGAEESPAFVNGVLDKIAALKGRQ